MANYINEEIIQMKVDILGFLDFYMDFYMYPILITTQSTTSFFELLNCWTIYKVNVLLLRFFFPLGH